MRYLTIIALFLALVLLLGCTQQVSYANSVGDVKVEFIPPTISSRCNAGHACIVSFQIKNVGTKRIYVGAGDFSEDTNLDKEIIILSSGSSSANLAPEEVSPTMNVNAFGNLNLDEGDYNIKIPLQVYDQLGHRIGESKYYLTGQIYYQNNPYCSQTITTNCRLKT